MFPQRNLNPRFQQHIARARRTRTIVGALFVTCLLVGTGAAFSQTQLPHQLTATLKPIASIVSGKLSQLPSALSQRIPKFDPQLPSASNQLAASATSFPQSAAEKVRNIFCRWLGCAAPDLADSSRISNENITNIGSQQRATLPPNVKQPARIPQTSPSDVARSATTTTQVVVSSASLSASNASPATPAQPVVPQPVIERTNTVIQTGLSEALLDARLLALTNDLNSRLAQVAAARSYQAERTAENVADATRIEQLTGLTAHDLTVDGVSGLTDDDLPDSLTASNYLPLTGGTLTGDLNIGGTLSASTLSVAGISSGGSIEAPYFTATSSTATSTFAGGLTGPNNFIVQSSSGRVGIGTTSPLYGLDVRGNLLGFNIDTPLHVTSDANYTGIFLDATKSGGTGQANVYFGANGTKNFQLGSGLFGDGTKDFFLWDNSNAAIRLYVSPTGNVGVGNLAPTYKLDVSGLGRFTGLVDAANFVATSTSATSTFAGQLAVGSNAFNVLANGKVGIGTASPASTAGATTFLDISNTTGGSKSGLALTNPVNKWELLSTAQGHLQILVGGSNRLFMDSTGLFGFNDSTPTYNLDVSGLGRFTGLVDAANFVATSTSVASLFNGGLRAYASSTIGNGTQAGGLTMSGGSTTTGNAYISGNVGIGIATPGSALNVVGKVGINHTGLGSNSLDVYSASAGPLAAFQSNGLAENESMISASLGASGLSNATAYTAGGSTTGYFRNYIQQNDNGAALWDALVLGSGDAYSRFGINGGQNWSLGLDNSDSDSFKISGSGTLGSNDFLTITSGGNVGIGTTTPPNLLSITTTANGQGITLDRNGTILGYLGSTQVGSAIGLGLEGVTGRQVSINGIANSNVLIANGGGNVGIGTTTPSVLFTAAGSAGEIARFDSTSASGGYASWTNSGSSLGNVGSALQLAGAGFSASDFTVRARNSLLFVANGGISNQYMILTSSGNVGIGTSTPTADFHISKGDGTGSVHELTFDNDGPVGNSQLIIGRNDTTIAADNPLGYLSFGGRDTTGNALTAHAQIWAAAPSSHAAGDNPTYLAFGTTPDGSSTISERLRITSEGNVGIGTTSPPNKLSITTVNNGDGITFDSSGTIIGSLGRNLVGSTVGLALEGVAGRQISVNGTASSNVLIANGGGNVGIGTTSPGTKLDVYGGTVRLSSSNSAYYTDFINAVDSANAFRIQQGGYDILHSRSGGGNTGLTLGLPGSTSLVIERNNNRSYFPSGNVGIGTTTPGKLLEIYGGASGAGANSSANLVLEDSGNNYLHFLTPNTAVQAVLFGDPENGSAGMIQYEHATDLMTLRAGGQSTLYLNSGNVGIGTTTPLSKLAVSGGASIGANYNTAAPSNGLIVEGNVGIGTRTVGNTALSVTAGTGGTGAIAGLIYGSTNTGTFTDQAGRTRTTATLVVGSDYNSSSGTVLNVESAAGDGLLLVRADGNVGIGTISPSGLLHLYGSGATARVENTNASGIADIVLRGNTGNTGQIFYGGSSYASYGGASSFNFEQGANAPIAFFTNGANERLRIDGAGNVGIGTTSPWRKLSVTGTVGFDGLTGSTGAGSLCLDANKQVVYNDASDSCLSSTRATKHDIQPLTLDALGMIQGLEPVSFIYNEGNDRTRFGFIAEDTAAVDPHLATYNASGTVSGIDDRAILSILVTAIKELAAKIANFAETFTTKELTFDRAYGHELTVDKLCVGQVCVTESQFMAVFSQTAGAATSISVPSSPSNPSEQPHENPSPDLTNSEQPDNANSTSTPTEPAAANDNPPAEDENATSTAAPEAANDNPAPTDVSAISTPDVTPPTNDNAPPVDTTPANDNSPPPEAASPSQASGF